MALRPLLAALLLAPVSPLFVPPCRGGLISEDMRQGAAATPSAQGQAAASVYEFDFGATAKPEKPSHVNLRMAEPDPDLLPEDNAGLTRATIDSGVKFEWGDKGFADRPGGKVFLFYADSIKVKFRLHQQVAVSETYPLGSCTYNETFKHELVHWEDNDETYKAAVKGLVEALERMREMVPVRDKDRPAELRAANVKEATSEVARYQNFVMGRVNQSVAYYRKRLGEIMRNKVSSRDSAFNYSQIYERCKGWTPAGTPP